MMTLTAYATAALAARHNSCALINRNPSHVREGFNILRYCLNSQIVMNMEEKKITTINTGQTNFIIMR